jgi:hypothetical protein
MIKAQFAKATESSFAVWHSDSDSVANFLLI